MQGRVVVLQLPVILGLFIGTRLQQHLRALSVATSGRILPPNVAAVGRRMQGRDAIIPGLEIRSVLYELCCFSSVATFTRVVQWCPGHVLSGWSQ